MSTAILIWLTTTILTTATFGLPALRMWDAHVRGI